MGGLKKTKSKVKTGVNQRVYGLARKAYLEKKGLINCSYCPYHRVENASRKPRHISWKRLRKNQFFDN